MPKNKQSELIASVKSLEYTFHQQRYYKPRNRERGASQDYLITNHFSQISFH